MGYRLYEQETSIMWDEEEKIARIYTASPAMIRKFDNLSANYPDAYKCVWEQDDGLAKKYEVSKRFIRFGKPASEAKKEAGRKIAAMMAERKNDGQVD